MERTHRGTHIFLSHNTFHQKASGWIWFLRILLSNSDVFFTDVVKIFPRKTEPKCMLNSNWKILNKSWAKPWSYYHNWTLYWLVHFLLLQVLKAALNTIKLMEGHDPRQLHCQREIEHRMRNIYVPLQVLLNQNVVDLEADEPIYEEIHPTGECSVRKWWYFFPTAEAAELRIKKFNVVIKNAILHSPFYNFWPENAVSRNWLWSTCKRLRCTFLFIYLFLQVIITLIAS